MSEKDGIPEIPEGAVETSRLTLRSYLLPGGKLGYAFTASEGSHTSELLGHLELVKHDILKRNDHLTGEHGD